MKSKLCLFSIFLALLAFPLSAAAARIEVVPMAHDFGDIEVGTSSTTIITIWNADGNDLIIYTIGFEGGSSSDFSITMVPDFPAVIAPGDWIDTEVAFTPSSEGYASAVLEILSNDHVEPLVTMDLSGVGVAAAPPPPETIEDILAFFDQSMADGTLCGDGPGQSANGRKKALRNKIKASGDIIEDGGDACEQLSNAYQRCDGLPRPPEFVAGPAAPVLANMILQLMADLGCE